jgi:hypothetical protein
MQRARAAKAAAKHAAKAAANASTQLARAPFTQGLAVHCFHLFPSLWHHREPPTVAIRLGGTTVGQPLLGRCRAAGFMRKSSAINATYSNKYQNYLVYSIYICIYIYVYIYYIWLVVWDHEFFFSHILGISSSQLTNSYLSEG